MALLYDWQVEDRQRLIEIPGEIDVFVRNDEHEAVYLYPGHPRHFWMFEEETAVCIMDDKDLSRIICPGDTHLGMYRVHTTTDRALVTCQDCLEYMHA